MAPVTLLIGAEHSCQHSGYCCFYSILLSPSANPHNIFFSVVNNVYVVVIYEISTIDLNKNILNTIFDIIILGGWGDKCVFF